MTHQTIFIQDLFLNFGHRTCFEGFDARIHSGERIGIIGANGAGKTQLMRMLCDRMQGVRVGYVPQVIEDHEQLSGGQRLNKVLSEALSMMPELLCLDEPTNHLDRKNRRSLMRMLDHFDGTLLVVSHDVELLERMNSLWHIAQGRVTTYAGFHDYQERMRVQRRTLEDRLARLHGAKREAHCDLMRDQERAKKKKIHGEKKYDGDKLALRSAQGRGQMTTNKNRKRIADDKSDVLAQLADLRLPEVIKPKFSLVAAELRRGIPLVRIRNGSCGYATVVRSEIHLLLDCDERVLIEGDNGSGKTTLARAIMSDPNVKREGEWQVPSLSDIGYLDQHYATLNSEATAIETIQAAAPHLKMIEIREHLNAYLLRKNEEVNLKVKFLSGGEKARLSLAQIGARTPRLLILDEVTNNLDLDTREHVIQVLQDFPGAMILISHDEDFARRVLRRSTDAD